MKAKRYFMSDNAAGVHPKVLEKIAMVNVGHEVAYGYDQYTQKATDLFKQHFGSEIEVLLTLTGTGSNVIALQSMLQSYHAVICGRNAHLYADECGAPEKFIGAKLIPIETYLGKLTIEGIKAALQDMHLVHPVQPKVVSITQATEWGTLYTIDEIKTIADFCRKYQLYLHMDGARLANAASALNVTFKQITTDLKVDVISFGGTKNGLLGAEAVIIVNPQLAKHSPFIRKQAMQLSSKMRFIAAQFLALFEDELWLQNANHANQMAKLLYEKIKYNTSIEIMMPVETNVVFAKIPQAWIDILQKEYQFAIWHSEKNIVRWMTSFDTTEKEVNDFAKMINHLHQSVIMTS